MTETPSGSRRLEASVLSAMALLGALMVVAPAVASGGDYLHDPLFWTFGAGLGAMVGILAVSRRGYATVAAHLFVATAFVLTWAFAFSAHGSGYLIGNFAYATVVVLLAAFFLRPQAVLLYALGNIVGVVAVQETFGLTRSDQITSYLYIVLFSGLLYAVAHQMEEEHRRRVEAVRTVERMRAEAARRDYQVAVLNRAAHRLQTPLTPLVLRLDALASRSGDWEEEDRIALGEARPNLVRLEGAVEDSLEAARIVQEPALYALQVCPVRPLLEAAAERFEEQRPRRVRVTVTAPEDLEASLDARRVQRLLAALLDNAADACPRGGEVRLWAAAEGDGVRIAVEDEGSGLGAEQKAALERFLSSGQETSDAAGLGLMLVRAIAAGHRATVRLDTTGQGTTVSVWFPSASR